MNIQISKRYKKRELTEADKSLLEHARVYESTRELKKSSHESLRKLTIVADNDERAKLFMIW